MIPPLITTTGLVLNNMMPGEGALGGYTPKGTASSEGISLMLRGIFRAAIATNDPEKLTIAKSLFDSACDIFYHGNRPADVANGQLWNHSWIANGGTSFTVRGPLDAYGNLAEGGFIYNRDSESTVSFVNGEATLNPPPDIVYQVVTESSTLVWNNVFSDLSSGTRLQVDFYIDSAGNQVFGSQTGGSFAQPAIKAGEHDAGDPGFIKLKTNVTGTCGVNYCVSVPAISVQHAELYEAWPMWRKMGKNEVSCAADAVHWFIDAYKLAKEFEPANAEWQVAIDKMLEVWQAICTQDSNNTILFKEGAVGEYNNFPLTYSYAFGKNSLLESSEAWQASANTGKYAVSRTGDGYVTFDLPKEDGTVSVGSNSPVRYGMGFENAPLYLTHTPASEVSVDVVSSVDNNVLSLSVSGVDGVAYVSSVLAPITKAIQNVSVKSFYRFSNDINQDSDGLASGDWTTDPGNELVLPTITAVPFPGRRVALIGDSITQYNTGYYPPNNDGRYEYFAQSMCGYFTYANAMLGQRFDFEPGIDPDLGAIGTYSNAGRNWGVASSKVSQWELPEFPPVASQPSYLRRGPMRIALDNLTDYDCVFMMGGTNDLSGGATATEVVNNLLLSAAKLAAEGKWVFLGAIPPRSRALLSGYTTAEADAIRARVVAVNAAVKARIESITDPLPNIWFVDYYSDLLGPNGTDPIGSLSQEPLIVDNKTVFIDLFSNFNTTYGDVRAFHDGLHPGPLGAYIMGKKYKEVCLAAGVPSRSATITEIPVNNSFTFTPYSLPVDGTGQPASANWSNVGWAAGLGSRLTTGVNSHNGFTYGKLPDNVHFYRGTNTKDQSIGAATGTAGTFSNFMEYTWSAFLPNAELKPFTTNSTWTDGQVTTSLVPVNGKNVLRVDLNIPAGTDPNNRNQSFVINAHVPTGVHGPWDNYGYIAPNYTGPAMSNTSYQSGDALYATADVDWEFSSARLNGARFVVNVLSIDKNLSTTSGAVVSGIMNSHNFWPPTELSVIHFPKSIEGPLAFKTPKVIVPASAPNETLKYSQVKFEFAFDNYNTPIVGTVYISNLRVIKD